MNDFPSDFPLKSTGEEPFMYLPYRDTRVWVTLAGDYKTLQEMYRKLDSKVQVLERWLREWDTTAKYLQTAVTRFLANEITLETLNTVISEHSEYIKQNKMERMIFHDLQE